MRSSSPTAAVRALVLAAALVLGPALLHGAAPAAAASGERAGADCAPHPPIWVYGDTGPTGFVLGDHPLTDEPVYRPGSGVSAGTGARDDPYIIEGWCLTSPPGTAAVRLDTTTAHVVIRGNAISGTTPFLQDTGVLLDKAVNVSIEANAIQGVTWGLQLLSSHDSTVQANTLTGTGSTLQGWAIRLLESSGNLVEGNEIHDNRGGVALESSSGNALRSNAIADNRSGVVLGGSTHNTVEDNVIADNGGDSGIRLDSSSDNNTIRANTISGVRRSDQTAGSGIVVRGDDTLIVGNSITDNDGHGIIVEWAAGNRIGGNAISGNGEDGIHLYVSDDHHVEGNTVTDNTGAGLRVAGSSDNVLSGNAVDRNRGGGARLELGFVFGILPVPSTGNVLRANAVRDNHSDGVVILQADDNVVESNVITGSARGVLLLGAVTNEVAGNRIADHSVTGVHLQQSSGSSVHGNTISGNAVHGLRLATSSDNELRDNAVSANGWGLVVEESVRDWITHNNISANTLGGLHALAVDEPIDVTHNWWGCAEGPGAPTCDAVTGSALFTPWLAAPSPNGGGA